MKQFNEDGTSFERNGNKKAVKLAQIGVNAPHSNVRVYTGVNAETGKTYKRVLPDSGAGRIGNIRPKGTV